MLSYVWETFGEVHKFLEKGWGDQRICDLPLAAFCAN